MFHRVHSVCRKPDVCCVPNGTFRHNFRGLEAGHFVGSKWNMTLSCVQAGHFSCSNEKISCVPSRTFHVFQTRHFFMFQARNFVCSMQNFKRLRNRKDGAEFDDSLTKSIATTQTFLFKVSRRRNFDVDKKCSRQASERANELTKRVPKCKRQCVELRSKSTSMP